MSREAMKLALETLEQISDEMFSPYGDPPISNAILALRAALDAPAPRRQPRLWYHPVSGRVRYEETNGWIPLYEHPKEWRGLTKEERKEMSMANRPYVMDMLEAHEEELKRRNT